MNIPIYIVDAFTEEPFKGNQAGVCLLKNKLDDSILQAIAFEMNLSETAFVILPDESKDFSSSKQFILRWFTPTIEIDLCGHATLASAHVLFSELHNSGTIIFNTLSGNLTVSLDGKNLTMDFPQNSSKEAKIIPEFIKYLKLDENDIIACEYDEKLANYLIEVKNKQILADIQPDYLNLRNYSTPQMRITGIIVTSKMDGNFDFASRYFAPWVGIDEDPVTGSSHTTLAPYWAKKLHKKNFHAIQLSKRTGTLKISISNDRVLLIGTAFTTFQGSFKLANN